MKSLIQYINEMLIEEGMYHCYFKPSNKSSNHSKFNFRLESHGHGAERDMERLITDEDVVSLTMDCWSRIKAGIENGSVLINRRKTRQKGCTLALHSSEKTKTGYLTIICFVSKYHKNSDVYDLEVITTWKGKTMDSYKEKNEEGKTMYHPEHGQVDIWDNQALRYYDKKDDI